MLPWLILLQIAPQAPPIRIDLTAATTDPRCDAGTANEVVVCGGRDSPYRLRPLPPIADGFPIPKAETAIGNVKATVETEQGNVGGIPTNRVMFRLKTPF